MKKFKRLITVIIGHIIMTCLVTIGAILLSIISLINVAIGGKWFDMREPWGKIFDLCDKALINERTYLKTGRMSEEFR